MYISCSSSLFHYSFAHILCVQFFLSSFLSHREVDARLKQAPAFSVRLWTGAVAMCGQYGDPPSLRIFLPQMAEFVACVVAGRLVCGAAVFLGAVPLGFVARGVDALFVAAAPAGREEDVAEAELWTVMVLGPLTMNVVQVLSPHCIVCTVWGYQDLQLVKLA